MTFNSYAMFCRRTEAPLKSRPYAAINQFIIIFFDPSTQFQGNEKITLCNTKKVQKSSWNET